MSIQSLSSRKKFIIMIGIMVGLLLAAIDSTIVATAMPKIISNLNGFEYYAWPFTAFLLTLTISMPLFGKLADLYGFKPTYIFGIIVFITASALCGISQGMIELIIFRGLQGIGGAILSSNSLAIIGLMYSAEQRAKYIGIAGAGAGLGSLLGPALGGFIVDNYSWRWIFYINVPIGIITLAIMLFALPNHKIVERGKKIDFWGVITLIIALIPMMLALTWGGSEYSWDSLQIISMFSFSALMLIIFVFIEIKAVEPILPLSIFRNAVYNFSVLEIFLSSVIMIGAALFLPLFVQGVIGKSASQSGAILTPLLVSMLIGSVISGFIVSKTGKYKLQSFIGFLVIGIGAFLLANMNVSTENSNVIIFMIVLGFGIGIVATIFNVTAQSSVTEDKMGVATSTVQFFKYSGQTIASSVFGTVLSSSLKNGLQDMNTGKLPEDIVKLLKDPNILSNTASVKSMASKLPNELLPDLSNIMIQMKQILSDSIHNVFVICIAISIFAAISVLFLKGIPIKQKNKDTAI